MSSTIRKIAQETGVSAATVSLALRGMGRISSDTRRKVQSAAKSLGYQPHPLLAKAFSMARRPEVLHYRESLAFIIEFPTEEGPEYQKLSRLQPKSGRRAWATSLSRLSSRESRLIIAG